MIQHIDYSTTPPSLKQPYNLGKLGITRESDQEAFAETVKGNSLVHRGLTVLDPRGNLYVFLKGYGEHKGLKTGKEDQQVDILHCWILEAAAHKAGRTVIATAASVEAGWL